MDIRGTPGMTPEEEFKNTIKLVNEAGERTAELVSSTVRMFRIDTELDDLIKHLKIENDNTSGRALDTIALDDILEDLEILSLQKTARMEHIPVIKPTLPEITILQQPSRGILITVHDDLKIDSSGETPTTAPDNSTKYEEILDKLLKELDGVGEFTGVTAPKLMSQLSPTSTANPVRQGHSYAKGSEAETSYTSTTAKAPEIKKKLENFGTF